MEANSDLGRPWGSRFTLFLLVCLAAAALSACLSEETPEPAPVQIPPRWERARLSPGHQAHLKESACRDCHSMAGERLGEPKADLCQSCHEDQKLHHKSSEAAGPCVACHQFDAPPQDVAFRPPDDCLSCHQEAQGEHSAVELHMEEPCLSCHKPHGDVGLKPRECTECHDEIQLSHGARSDSKRPVHSQCLDCHEAHEKGHDPAQECITCHAPHDGKPPRVEGAPQISQKAIFAPGHDACDTCHDSHDLKQAALVSCKNCHEGHQTLGAQLVPEHDDCRSCHNPHDVRGSLSNACESCHKSPKSDHPRVEDGLSACVSCHAPHGKKSGTHPLVTQDCADCHKEANAKKGHGEKDLSCDSCHKPHSFTASVQVAGLCLDCHQENTSQARSNPGHSDCNACHAGLPHHPESKGATCESCHEEQSGATTKHSECVSCHSPHSGAQGASCASCHQAEARSAHTGHRDCSSCHDPHSENPRKVTATCGSCHKKQGAANPHDALKTGCATCHRPHGPSAGSSPKIARKTLGPARVPSCTTCHAIPDLPSLHSVAGHNDCTNCHQPHQKGAKRDRASCTSCHEDQKQHQPDAQNCASCHLFGPARPPKSP